MCVPPFGEEMNRCRSMVTLQARAFAQLGLGTLLLDLHGTGDSFGEYVDARWDIWRNDIQAGVDWLNKMPGQCKAIWGIRLGAILASEALNAVADPKVAFIAWQPVISGQQHFTQFLRMRIAAQMNQSAMQKETTSSMRAQLAAGTSLEVSGYEVHPKLAIDLDAVSLNPFRPLLKQRVLWLEKAASDASQISPGSQKIIDSWSDIGANIDIRAFEGPNFWQVAERAIAQAAIDSTTSWARHTWARA